VVSARDSKRRPRDEMRPSEINKRELKKRVENEKKTRRKVSEKTDWGIRINRKQE
jgi:hypothetical protein